MIQLAILCLIVLVIDAVGFKNYVWFFSIGYGFSIAALGIGMLVLFFDGLNWLDAALCLILAVYGVRLGGYLLAREVKSAAYHARVAGDIKKNSDVGIGGHVGIWLACVVLYLCMTAPVFFRLLNGADVDATGIVGAVIMVCGMVLEAASDAQKSRAKAANPGRFCDTGLFRLVRCPNYLGELVLWTGVLVSGLGVLSGPLQWAVAIVGWLGIVYVMFGGARRIEIRQNRSYGDDPEYQRYVREVPIMIPFVPLYSVEKYKWLMA